MAQAAPFIAIAASVAGTYMSFSAQSEASAFQKQEARDARLGADIDSRNLARTNAIEASNLKTLQEKEESYNKAKAYASGMTFDDNENSFGLVMAEQRQTNAEQLANLKSTGASNVERILRDGESAYNTGQYQADASMAGAWGTLIGGASDVYDTGSAVD